METGSGKGRFRKYRTPRDAPASSSSSTLPFGHVPARVRLTLIVALGLLFAAVAGFVAFRGGRETAGSRRRLRGALRPPDLRAEPFAGLHDEEGRPLSLARFQGQVVVMTFLYTTCKDTCPLTAQQIRGALDDLGTDVPVVAVSVDPANDTESQRQALPRRAADDRADALRARLPTPRSSASGAPTASRRSATARSTPRTSCSSTATACSASAGRSTGSRPRGSRTTSASSGDDDDLARR